MEIKKLFVAGAGLMGLGIAQVAAQNGYEVSIYDISSEALKRGLENISRNLSKQVVKGKMTETEKLVIMSHFSVCSDIGEAADADIVIEAVSENEDIKADLFKKISEVVGEKTIIATNTSSLSVSSLASAIKRPERFVGLHFFSPVPAMKLLEIVAGFLTSEETIAMAKEFGKSIGKVTIIAKDEPGFIVNRMIDPMGNEAVKLLERGVGTIEDIDKGCRYGLNHPIGPLELMDAAGIDIEYAAMKTIFEETGDPAYRPAVLLRTMVKSGYIGKKVGKGWYIYHEDGTKTPNPAVARMLRK